jgi:hypothetical protein
MWMFEILGLTAIVGVFLGLAWHVTEDWLEKRASRREIEIEATSSDQPTDSTPTIVVTAITPVYSSTDEKRKAEEQLEAKLLEGLNSPENELTPADWTAIRQEALARLETRKKHR